jgi:rare lipoprotein A (peptidoglycan hydrolase)
MRLVHLTVGVALLITCSASPLSASPAAQVESSRAALRKAVSQYDEARKELSAVQASVEANSAKLDSLLTQQSDLEAKLGRRADLMYRTGPLGFLEVLAGSATFEQFLTVWDALLRLNREDVDTIRQVRKARSHVEQTAVQLMARQEEASRRLRALEKTKSQAAKTLAEDQAAYADYQREVAAREAVARSGSSSGSAAASSKIPAPTPVARRMPAGTGAWKSAVASHYGTGSYGLHLSSGVTIGPDSMIVAHKTLPFGTLVEFSYRGRTAVAKVADRGPYTRGREFDLGPGVARVLGFRGVNEVQYRVIGR